MDDPNNLQHVLWSASTPMFWRGMSLVATLNVVLLFYALLVNHERNALTYARLMWLGGAILAIFIPWNSGMMIWSLAAIITAGAWMSILVNTNWCARRGTFPDKVLSIVRETIWHKKPNSAGND